MRIYKKPVVTVDAGMAEGVYAASGASKGTSECNILWVYGTDGESNGGKGLAHGGLVGY